jgi:hypothetical protein
MTLAAVCVFVSVADEQHDGREHRAENVLTLRFPGAGTGQRAAETRYQVAPE